MGWLVLMSNWDAWGRVGVAALGAALSAVQKVQAAADGIAAAKRRGEGPAA
jgi:hypothetical protein